MAKIPLHRTRKTSKIFEKTDWPHSLYITISGPSVTQASVRAHEIWCIAFPHNEPWQPKYRKSGVYHSVTLGWKQYKKCSNCCISNETKFLLGEQRLIWNRQFRGLIYRKWSYALFTMWYIDILLTHRYRINDDTFLFVWKSLYFNQISLSFVPKCPIDDKSALVQVMLLSWRGPTPLSETVLTQLTEACVSHWAVLSYVHKVRVQSILWLLQLLVVSGLP